MRRIILTFILAAAVLAPVTAEPPTRYYIDLASPVTRGLLLALPFADDRYVAWAAGGRYVVSLAAGRPQVGRGMPRLNRIGYSTTSVLAGSDLQIKPGYSLSDFTISMWLHFNAGFSVTNQNLTVYSSGGSGDINWFGAVPRLHFPGVDRHVCSGAWGTGATAHFTMTRAGTTHTCYYHGAQVSTGTNLANTFTLDRVGMSRNGGTHGSYQIANLLIWNRALTAAEIRVIGTAATAYSMYAPAGFSEMAGGGVPPPPSGDPFSPFLVFGNLRLGAAVAAGGR